MSSFLVFYRVYRLEIQSVMLVFSIQLCELASNLLFGSPPPTPPSLPKVKAYVQFIHTVCGWDGGCWAVLLTIFCRSLTLCFWPNSEPTKLLDHPNREPLGWEGPRTDKHLPQSLFAGQFFKITTFGVAFYRSILSTVFTPPPPCLSEYRLYCTLYRH